MRDKTSPSSFRHQLEQNIPLLQDDVFDDDDVDDDGDDDVNDNDKHHQIISFTFQARAGEKQASGGQTPLRYQVCRI